MEPTCCLQIFLLICFLVMQRRTSLAQASDHNGSISNPCLTSSDLLKRAYLQPLPQPFSLYGAHRFIMLSGYRTSPRDFVAVGLQYIINGAQAPTSCPPTTNGAARKAMYVHNPQLPYMLTLLCLSPPVLCFTACERLPWVLFVKRPLQVQDVARNAVHLFALLVEPQCFWIGADGATIDGELNARYTDKHHGLMYETVIHRCRLEGPTPLRQPGKAIMIIGWSA